MPLVKGPNGIALNFPDGTDPQTIDRVMRQAMQQQGAAPETGTPAAPVPQGGSWADPFIGQGLLMGFGDEMKAGVRGAARRAFGDNPGKSLSDLYGEELRGTRADLGEFQQRHPVLSPTLELGGALASTPFVPGGAAAKGANILQRGIRGAIAGTTQGALYGAGTAEGGLQDRAIGAGQGALYGAAGGAAAPLVVRGAQAGLRAARDYGTAPAARLARDALANERGAKARIGNALAEDATVPQQPRLTPADEAVAARHGVPIYNLDRGGEHTRALAQSAGITSPTGRATLKQAILDRFQGQGERTEGALQNIVGGNNTFATGEALQQQARRQNRGNYAWAYGAGDRPIWSNQLAQLTSSNAVKEAMKNAAVRGNDRAVAEGFGGFNPGVSVDPSGIIRFQRGASGTPAYPNIQYWDYVQRELRDAAGAARRRGENEQAGALTQLHQSLNKELDKLVPAFGNARKGAARFFGAEDALEAGQKYVKTGSTMSTAEAQAVVRKMSPAEQQLFAEGAKNEVTARVGKRGENRDINLLFNNKDIKQRLQIALGPARAREFEAYLRVERLVDKARPTVSGFSDTARLLGERGLAGGVSGGLTGLGIGYGTGDWRTGLASGIAAALLRRGGAHVNQNVARRVAEMLVSNDPAIMKQGAALVANNDRWMDALRHLDRPLGIGASMTAQKNIPVSGIGSR
jgi:hypothetical protein